MARGPSAGRLHDLVTREVVFRILQALQHPRLCEITTGNATRNLERLGIVSETTGRRRNTRFVDFEYRLIVDEGTAD